MWYFMSITAFWKTILLFFHLAIKAANDLSNLKGELTESNRLVVCTLSKTIYRSSNVYTHYFNLLKTPINFVGSPRNPTRDLIIFLRQILLPNRIASFSRNSHYKLLSQTGVPNNFLWQHYKNVATFIWSTLLRGV